MTGINVPIRIGRATVLPGDLILAKRDGLLVIPAPLAQEAIATAEFTGLTDDYNFQLNLANKNGGSVEGGWDDAKFAGFKKYIDEHPEKLKMSRAEFDKMLQDAINRLHSSHGRSPL